MQLNFIFYNVEKSLLDFYKVLHPRRLFCQIWLMRTSVESEFDLQFKIYPSFKNRQSTWMDQGT